MADLYEEIRFINYTSSFIREWNRIHALRKKVLKCFITLEDCIGRNCCECESNSKYLEIKLYSNFVTVSKFLLKVRLTESELFALMFEYPEMVKTYKECISQCNSIESL